jgi:hypothetical protein
VSLLRRLRKKWDEAVREIFSKWNKTAKYVKHRKWGRKENRYSYQQDLAARSTAICVTFLRRMASSNKREQ